MTGLDHDSPVVLFVTYTMRSPIVGGVFFRALRLAAEFNRRGWSPTICNVGPMLDDPKIEAARREMRFIELSCDTGSTDSLALRRFFASFNPSVLVMGESAFPAMQVFYDGARAVGRPFVVLDQFYNHELLPRMDGVALAPLYGLKSFWKDDLRLSPPYVLVPPFIESVTPRAELPVAAQLRDRPWVTLVAYELNILRQGVELLRAADGDEVALIVISHYPDEAAKLLRESGFPPERAVNLPALGDADVFGFMSASRVVVVSNGFLQIMDSLAVGAPVVALERGAGVGMSSFNIDHRFDPFVSFQESRQQQCERIRCWLKRSPFPPALLDELKAERGGARVCAAMIEKIALRPRHEGVG